MITPSSIGVTVGSGVLVDTVQVLTSAGTVQREIVSIGSPDFASGGMLYVGVSPSGQSGFNALYSDLSSLSGGYPLDTNSGLKSPGTQRVILATDQPSLVNPIPISYGIPTSSAYSQVTVTVSASGDTTVIAGVGGQTIRVFSINVSIGGTTNVTVRSAATPKTGIMPFNSGGGISEPLGPNPIWVCGIGEAFIINQSNAVLIGGWIDYTIS